MQSRHSFLLSLVCAMVIICAVPLIAQTSQQQGAPSPPHGIQAGPPAARLFARRSEQIAPQPAPSGNTAETGANGIIQGPYRLTYTLTEMDGDEKIGTQHYTLLLDANGRPAHAHFETKVSVLQGQSIKHYDQVHIAISLNSDLKKLQNELELRSGVDQTSIADNQQKNEQDMSEPLPPPVTREAELYSSVLMQENKPMTLWKLDIPGSTHVLEVQVELTRLH